MTMINNYIDLIDALVLARQPRSLKYIRVVLSSSRSLHLAESGDCGKENRDLSLDDPSIVSDVDPTLETREPSALILHSSVSTSEV